MLIQYCSDLHLEFAQNSLFLHKNPIKSVGDGLILAGDITYWGKKHFKHWFFDYVSEHFKAVYYVPGNHEFYSGKDLRIIDTPVLETIRENVFLVNNKVISIKDVDFFFTKLRSHIPDSKPLYVEHGVGDFHYIKHRGKRLDSTIFNQRHKDSLTFLKESITASKAPKKVVATHHIPIHLCNPEHYKTSNINSAFVSEQQALIEEWDIDYWIYGHHHANMPETRINETKLVTNQLGYIDLGEHHSYRNSARFEI